MNSTSAKFIFITGGVVSSLGKGLASASLGAVLQARGYNIKLRKLDDLNFFKEIPENEDTIEANATFKAEFINNKFDVNVFADDTGLEVESLNGKPGVHSARFAGRKCDSNQNIK